MVVFLLRKKRPVTLTGIGVDFSAPGGARAGTQLSGINLMMSNVTINSSGCSYATNSGGLVSCYAGSITLDNCNITSGNGAIELECTKSLVVNSGTYYGQALGKMSDGSGIAVASDSTYKATVTIGSNSAALSTTNPTIKGDIYGLDNYYYNTTTTVYFYNGILQGKTAAYSSAPTGRRSGATLRSGSSGGFLTAYFQ